MKMNNYRLLLSVYEGEEEPEGDTFVAEVEPVEGDEPAEGEAPKESSTDDWRQSLSEDIRNNDLVKDAESLETFVANAIKPSDPIDPQSYQLPENLDNEDVRKALAETNVNAEGLEKILGVVTAKQDQESKARHNAKMEGLGTLYKGWGDKKSENLNVAQSFLEQFDPDKKLAKLLKTSQSANEPEIVDFFYRVGNAMKEDGFLKVREIAPAAKKSAAQTLYPNQGKD